MTLQPDDIKVGEQSVRLLTNPTTFDREAPAILAYAARTCTGTEYSGLFNEDPELQYQLLKRLLGSKHMSIFEHCSITVELVTNRSLSHQLVRHRIAAYAQKSMRYVKFTSARGKDQLYVIRPYEYDSWTPKAQYLWRESIVSSVLCYDALIEQGVKAEDARGVLPQDISTKLIATWNLRQLLHILYDSACGRLRNKHAQPQIRELMGMLETELKQRSKFLKFLLEMYTAYAPEQQ